MKHLKPAHWTFGVFALSSILAVPPAEAARARAGSGARCEALFKAETESPKSKARARSQTPSGAVAVSGASSSTVSKSAIVVQAEASSLPRDLTVLATGPSVSRAPRIGLDYLSGHETLTRTAEGDFIDVDFYVKGNPRAEAAPVQTALGNSSGRGHELALSGARGSSLAIRQSSAPISAQDAKALVRQLIVEHDLPPGHRIDSQSIDLMVSTLHSDPATLARAKEYALKKQERGNYITDAVVVRLGSVGLNRYFRFTPAELGTEVDARVLDMNRVKNPEGYNILVEWIRPSTENTLAVRTVSLLKVEELGTIGKMPETLRGEIATRFEDLLSPNEIKTRKFAQLNGNKTVGLTQFAPGGGSLGTRGEQMNMFDPVTLMSGYSDVVSRARFESRFGSAADLLSTSESQNPRLHMYDVTSRMNPGFVLNRLNAHNTQARFAFVVTEDGQLKVTPHLAESTYDRPDYIRLAHGRRVFAHGIFVLAGEAGVRVVFDSSRAVLGGYESPSYEQAARVNRLVSLAFFAQAGREVLSFFEQPNFENSAMLWASLSGRREGWTSSDFYNSAYEALNSNLGDGRFYDPQSAPRSNPAPAPSAKAKSRTTLSWDTKDAHGLPLPYDAWVKEYEKTLGRTLDPMNPLETHIGWAHYVLKSNPDMSKDEIKKSYRRLIQKFHPDRWKSNRPYADVAGSTVVSAWNRIEGDLK